MPPLALLKKWTAYRQPQDECQRALIERIVTAQVVLERLRFMQEEACAENRLAALNWIETHPEDRDRLEAMATVGLTVEIMRFSVRHESHWSRVLFQSLYALDAAQEVGGVQYVFRVSPSDVSPFCVAAAVSAAPEGNQPGAAETAAATQKSPENQPSETRNTYQTQPTKQPPGQEALDAAQCRASGPRKIDRRASYYRVYGGGCGRRGTRRSVHS